MPSAKWRKEQIALVAERVNLLGQYYSLRGEIKDAEMIKRRIVFSLDFATILSQNKQNKILLKNLTK
ncbi:MAG: hypothetical protein FWC13_08190 [Oscillospiraceae bacterium]|nr:hypothetical protein [Oscillospiraceae bacterium]